jgi:hypothetical protein
MALIAEVAELAAFARAMVPPSRPLKAAVSTRELFEIFMTSLSLCPPV